MVYGVRKLNERAVLSENEARFSGQPLTMGNEPPIHVHIASQVWRGKPDDDDVRRESVALPAVSEERLIGPIPAYSVIEDLEGGNRSN